MTPGNTPSIVFATSELVPLATSGGLGDVSRSLPRALAALGHPVSVFLPYYQSVRRRGIEAHHVATLSVPGHGSGFRIFQAPGALAPAELFLVEHDHYFDRPGLYGGGGGEYADNLERYAFFCRTILEAIAALDLPADIVHANDWHTALLPAYLRVYFRDHSKLGASRSVFTIHNLAFQGRHAGTRLAATGLPASEFHIGGVEYYSGVNLMKAGIVYADAVTTVSPRYAQEIRTPEFGEGLDGLLRARSDALSGILNGIDADAWNPETDPHLPARYGRDAIAGKRACKEALFAELGLRVPLDTPLVGMVTRMTRQKGSDLVLEASAEILGLGVALAVLGSGDPDLEQGFRYLADWYGGRVAIRIGYDEALSHRIEGGSDLFLMPSRYEPCGLNQMYSLRYGTVPVVRATGGLDDTGRDPAADSAAANGFKFRPPFRGDLVAALGRAVGAYWNPGGWDALRRTGMGEDLSWSVSARKYVELYRRLAG